MKKILVLLIPVVALMGGVAAGAMLRPDADKTEAVATQAPADGHAEEAEDHAPEETTPHAEAPPAEAHGDSHATADEGGHGDGGHDAASAEGWFTFPSQFFVPLMRNGDMGAVMILTLSIETGGGELSAMKQQEHRLRDALLRELLIHANTGGFDGNFTVEARLAPLRERLQKAAQASTDLPIKAVLIEDIVRQAG